MGTGWRPWWPRRARAGRGAGDKRAAGRRPAGPTEPEPATAAQETAELTASYWQAYDERMMTVGFRDVARRFPGLVGQAIRLGWSASPLDTAATIGLNIVSGVLLIISGLLAAWLRHTPALVPGRS